MKRHIAAVTVAAAAAGAAQAQAAESLREALAVSKPSVDWRVRYEGVEQIGFTDDAEALTSRLRAGVRTGSLGGTSLLAEGVWVEDVRDDYNSTTNGGTGYPIVADPTGFAAVNRFALINESLENTVLTIGRQRILHGNTRFVGNVGWRQHEQTFDGVRAEIKAGKSSVDVAYANQANRVFGPDSPVGKWEGDMVLARATRAFAWGELAGFGYLLELDDAPALSSSTFGVEATGSRPLDERWSVRYAATYALQADRGPNPADFDEDYVRLEAGLAFRAAAVDLGRETLGGDGQNAFATPLATLHVFQGWADKLGATPPQGIEDTYLRLRYSFGAKGPFEAISLVAALHDFDSDAGSMSYGDETDLSVVARLARMTFTVKYADYAADALFTDTEKLWLSLEYAF